MRKPAPPPTSWTRRPFPRLQALLRAQPIARLQALADAHGLQFTRLGRENESLLASKIEGFLSHSGRFQQVVPEDPALQHWLRAQLALKAPRDFDAPSDAESVTEAVPPRLLAAGLVYSEPASPPESAQIPMELALLLGTRWARPDSLFHWLGRYPSTLLEKMAVELRRAFRADLTPQAPSLLMAGELVDWIRRHVPELHADISETEHDLLTWIASQTGCCDATNLLIREGSPLRMDLPPTGSRDPLQAVELGWTPKSGPPPGFFRLVARGFLLPAGEPFAPWRWVALERSLSPTNLHSLTALPPPPQLSTEAPGKTAGQGIFLLKRVLTAAACGGIEFTRAGGLGKIGVRQAASLLDLDTAELDRLLQWLLEIGWMESRPHKTGRRLYPSALAETLWTRPEPAMLRQFAREWATPPQAAVERPVAAALARWLSAPKRADDFIEIREGWRSFGVETATFVQTGRRSRASTEAAADLETAIRLATRLGLAEFQESHHRIRAARFVDPPPDDGPPTHAVPPPTLLPNFDVLVSLEAGPGELAGWAGLAELKRVDRMCQLHLSADSLASALLQGWTPESIRSFLSERLTRELPPTVQALLRDLDARAGEVALVEGRWILSARHATAAALIAADPALEGLFQDRPAETVWLLKPGADPEKVLARLRERGLIPQPRQPVAEERAAALHWAAATPRAWDNLRAVIEAMHALALRMGIGDSLRTQIEEALDLVIHAGVRRLGSAEAARKAVEALDAWADGHVESLFNRRLAAREEGKKKAESYAGPNPATARADIRRMLTFCRQEGLKVEIVYDIGGRGAAKARPVTPKAVDDHYLEAWCHHKKGERLFRLDRIESARLVEETSEARRSPRRGSGR